MGVKLKNKVCNTNIHFPFLEVGLNLHMPLEISWIIELETFVPDLFTPDAKKIVSKVKTIKYASKLSLKIVLLND